MAFARSRWVSPIGRKNSSKSIAPGCVGTRWVGMRILTLPPPPSGALSGSRQFPPPLAPSPSSENRCGIGHLGEYYVAPADPLSGPQAGCLGESGVHGGRSQSQADRVCGRQSSTTIVGRFFGLPLSVYR